MVLEAYQNTFFSAGVIRLLIGRIILLIFFGESFEVDDEGGEDEEEATALLSLCVRRSTMPESCGTRTMLTLRHIVIKMNLIVIVSLFWGFAIEVCVTDLAEDWVSGRPKVLP